MTFPSDVCTSAPWLSSAAFAAAYGISERAARRALSRALDGMPWRGNQLTVREVPSRGGRSGVALEVLASSLPSPPDEAAPAEHLPTVAGVKLRGGDTGARIRPEDRHRIIQPALRQPHGSTARALAVAEAAAEANIGQSTVYAWITAHEKHGYAGLQRKRRDDDGRRRYSVSARWDAAVTFDGDTGARIRAELERHVRSLYACNTEYGARVIARMASGKLRELTRKAGHNGDPPELKEICRVSTRFVRRHQKYRAVAIHDLDAKQWNDTHRGRIERTRAGRLPMDLVVGDVHPMDVQMLREEGGTFTPKLICWQDWATNRLFVHPVFLDKGEGVRQEHVAKAFIAMTQDPEWGMPNCLYLDNGGEYRIFDLVKDAMALTTRVRPLQDDLELHTALKERRTIVNALPYNAAAKSIEGAFSVLEKSFFSVVPGWIGGQRMAKKTANVGRAPVPYPHDKETFRRDLATCMAMYDTNPQNGALDGRSPREAFAAAVDAGWKRRHIERGALLAVFARKEERVVLQGAFKYENKRYTSPEIEQMPARTRLFLRVPICGGQDRIPVMNEDGDLLCVAEVAPVFDALDPEGAREAGRRHAASRAGVRRLRADIDALDPVAEYEKIVSDEAPAPTPESGGVIHLSPALEETGHALENHPDAASAMRAFDRLCPLALDEGQRASVRDVLVARGLSRRAVEDLATELLALPRRDVEPPPRRALVAVP